MSLSAADFQFVTTMIRQRSSIDLQPGKEYLVESRLSPVARAAGLADLNALVAKLRQGDSHLSDLVVDALTTNETSWFRDSHPFNAFTEHIIPEVTKGIGKSITVWSAACSSGQEGYSLAMLLKEWMESNPGARAQIHGTDISPKMVERARSGTYSQLEVNRGLPAAFMVKYFDKSGREWSIKPELRSMCKFEKGNLALPPVGVPSCDVVFLRNVLIYFDIETKRKVLANVRKVLKPGGFMVLGGAESTLSLDSAFTRMELGKAVVFKYTGGKA